MKIGIVGIIIALTFAIAPAFASDTDADALLRSARGSFDEGDFEGAEEALKRALDVTSSDARKNSACLQNIAFMEFMNFNFSESEKFYEKALPFTTQAAGDDSLELANNLFGLSRSMRRQNKLAEAEPILQRIASIRIKQLGDEHRLVSNSYFDLAVNCDRLGKTPEAINYYAKTLCIREKLFGKSSKALTGLLESYCAALKKTNDFKTCDEMAKRLDVVRSNDANESVPAKEADGNGWIDIQ